MRKFCRVIFPPEYYTHRAYTYDMGNHSVQLGDFVAVPPNIYTAEGGIAKVFRIDGEQAHLENIKEIKTIWRVIPIKEALRILKILPTGRPLS